MINFDKGKGKEKGEVDFFRGKAKQNEIVQLPHLRHQMFRV